MKPKFETNIIVLSDNEMKAVNGGEAGDAAYWIGRTYVYGTLHLLTFGMSTLYLALKQLE